MGKVINSLKRTILLSNSAYQYYLHNGKLYYQAKRIYKANQEIYILLMQYKDECDKLQLEVVFDYIFHLNDWLLQFEFMEREIKELDEEFIFKRFPGSIPYPQNFLKVLS